MLSLCCLSTGRYIFKAFHMSEPASKNLSRPSSREERLAAKLRENLRRRKAQGKAQARASDADPVSESGESGLPKPGGAG